MNFRFSPPFSQNLVNTNQYQQVPYTTTTPIQIISLQNSTFLFTSNLIIFVSAFFQSNPQQLCSIHFCSSPILSNPPFQKYLSNLSFSTFPLLPSPFLSFLLLLSFSSHPILYYIPYVGGDVGLFL